MQQGIIPGLMGLSAGFMIGKAMPVHNEENANALSLQREINESLLASIKYEEAIKKLQQQLLIIENSGPTNDFLKLQLKDLQDNYDALMVYARSKIPDLPTSFIVAETPVEGLHFNPNIFFDRQKPDRNISLVDGVITIKGVKTYKTPVYMVEKGILHELKSAANPTLQTTILQLTPDLLSCQIKLGANEKICYPGGARLNDIAEPLVLIEFDKSVDLTILLNNIGLGYARHSGNARWDTYVSGGVSLYRRNILAFKLWCLYADDNFYIANLVLKTLVNSLQLPVLSVAVVDSMHSSLNIYAGAGRHDMTPSYKLVGKKVDYPVS